LIFIWGGETNMKLKVITILTIIALSFVILAGCSKTDNSAGNGEEIVLTIEELAQYDGKDGRKAYVAVDGIIYDMTNSSAWRMGMHNGFQAGRDLTEAIKKESPHGVSKLSNVPRIGKLAE
jgi:predicted heme/steroid binding protein